MSESDLAVQEKKTEVIATLRAYADSLANMSDAQAPSAFDFAVQMADLMDEVRNRLRDRLLMFTQVNGNKVTEKGSMGATAGGFRLTAIPTRSGTDPKKLEALLRRKGIDPAGVMDATLTFKVNQAHLIAAQASGKLTQEDVAACAYDKAFRMKVERENSEEGSE